MQNYDKALGYMGTSAESSGVALEKFGIYQDSLAAKSESLSAALQGLTMTLVDSDLVKGFLDFSTAIVSGADGLAQMAGALPTIIGGLSSVLSMMGKTGTILSPAKFSLDGFSFGNTNFKQLSQQIKEYNSISEKSTAQQIRFNNALVATNPQMLKYLQTVQSGNATLGGYAASLVGTTVKTFALQAATVALNAALTMGIAFAIQGLVTLFTDLAQSQENARQAALDAANAFSSESSEIESQIDSVRRLRTELETAISNNDDQRTYELKREIFQVQSDIVDKYGEQVAGIDLVNGNLDATISKMQEISRLNAEAFLNNPDNLTGLTSARNYMENPTHLGAKASIDLVVGTLDESNSEIDSQIDALFKSAGLRFDESSFVWMLDVEPQVAKDTLTDLTTQLNDLIAINPENTERIQQYLGLIGQLNQGLAEHSEEFELYSFEGELRALTEYSAQYGLLENAVESFNETVLNAEESDLDSIEARANAYEELQDAISAIDSDIQNGIITNEAAITHFREKIDEILNSSSNILRFEIDFGQEDGRLQDRITQIRDTFLEEMNDIEILTIPYDDEATTSQQLGYQFLIELAQDYKMEIEEIIPLLADLGVIQRDVANTELKLDLDMSDNLSAFNEEINALYSQFDMLNTAFDQLNETGHLTASTFQQLSDNNLLQYIDFTTMSLNNQGQALLDNEAAARQKAKTDLQLALAENLVEIATRGMSDAEWQAQGAATGAVGPMNNVAAAISNIAPEALNSAAAVQELNNALRGQTGGKTLDWNSQKAQINAVVSQYQNAVRAVDSISYSSNSANNAFGGLTNAQNSNTGSSKQNTEATKAAAAAQRALTEELKAQKEALEDQEDFINDLLEMTIKMLKQESKLRKEQINAEIKSQEQLMKLRKEDLEAELKAYKARLDAQKALLREREEERDYQKDLQERQKEVTDLESRLEELRRDDSEATQKKRLELEDELSNKRESLAEFQHDRGIDLAEDTLDKEYARFEEIHNAKIEALETEYDRFKELREQEIQDIETYLSTEGQIRQDAIALIEGRTQDFYNRLITWNRLYSSGVDADVSDAWNNAYKALESYNNGQILVIETLRQISALMQEVEARTKNATSAANDYYSALGSGGNGSSGGSGSAGRGSSGTTHGVKHNGRVIANTATLEQAQAIAAQYRSEIDSMPRPAGMNMATWNEEKRTMKASYVAYAKGTPYVPFTQKALINEKGEEIIVSPKYGNLVTLKKGSGVIPHTQTEKLMDLANALPNNVSGAVSGINSSVLSSIMPNTSTVSFGDFVFTGDVNKDTLPDLKRTLQQFERKIYKNFAEGMVLSKH